MTWDAYITSNLMMPVDTNGNHLDSAAILGQDGSEWAKSKGFPEVDVAEVLAAMSDATKASIIIAGVKYMKVASEETVLRCRKGTTGFIASKTHQALVVGFYSEPGVDARTCSKVVEAMSDYLNNTGY